MDTLVTTQWLANNLDQPDIAIVGEARDAAEAAQPVGPHPLDAVHRVVAQRRPHLVVDDDGAGPGDRRQPGRPVDRRAEHVGGGPAAG